MQYVWYDVQIEDIEEAQRLARERGKTVGTSYEAEFLEVMAKKGKKPSGGTELTPTELLQEYASHDKKVAHLKVDSQGSTVIEVIKKNENFDENR